MEENSQVQVTCVMSEQPCALHSDYVRNWRTTFCFMIDSLSFKVEESKFNGPGTCSFHAIARLSISRDKADLSDIAMSSDRFAFAATSAIIRARSTMQVTNGMRVFLGPWEVSMGKTKYALPGRGTMSTGIGMP